MNGYILEMHSLCFLFILADLIQQRVTLIATGVCKSKGSINDVN